MGKRETNASLLSSHLSTQKHNSTEDYLYYLLALSVFAFSFFIHSPCPRCPTEYSDLYSLFFQVFSHSERWFSGTLHPIGIPYVDYTFEYPPVIAGIFYSASVISAKAAQWAPVPRATVFFDVLALIFVLPAYVVYLKIVRDMSKHLAAGWSRQLFAAAGFGIAYYVVYNFDIIAIAFAVFSLLLLIRGRSYSAGFLLGLSVASKIFTGVILFPSLLYLTRRNPRSAVYFFLCFSLTIFASFGPVLLFAQRGLLEMLRWNGTWYCENCFYVMMVTNLWDSTWRLLSQALMVLLPLGVMFMIRPADDKVALFSRSLLMIPAAISVSYVYSPQMNVMIAPAYLLSASPLAFATLAVSDFLNMLIMVFFLRPDTLCRILSIQSCPPVWERGSPIQWMAFSRIVLLWVFIIAATLRSRAKHGRGRGSGVRSGLFWNARYQSRKTERPSHPISDTGVLPFHERGCDPVTDSYNYHGDRSEYNHKDRNTDTNSLAQRGTNPAHRKVA